ncbi:uncharacterized protein A4U43_C06F18380 [Asparagus officinalis]|uniref:Uncharacterized protein n=1 Tax=Asparagus officinalis TaxID=4686 RepID=A0A5P1EMN9_ASPOF|nr:protein PLANT CADMIUM RESISTANCE 3-like [Asparagus officinalis]ONK67268.1 uncharacterized protein A4U43_C06F18380 [Asparagus officinalis]
MYHHQHSSQGYDPSKFQHPVQVQAPAPAPPQAIRSSPYPAPAMYPPSNGGPAQWSTGLCHCFDDLSNCLVTCFCPCITFGQIADIVDRGTRPCSSSGTAYGLLLGFTGLACLYSCVYRSKLRAQYDLEETHSDCLVHFCCEVCALCQEYRELKNRGFDMSIGWNANVDRQRRGVIQPPVMGAPVIGGAMMR